MTDSTVLDDRVDQPGDAATTSDARSHPDGRGSAGLFVLRDLAIVVVATLVPLVVVFRLWDGGLGNPFTYFGDSHFYGGVAQNIIQTGWYQHTDRLGAPTGQQMYDFPLGGDNFWWLVLRVMALFTSDWALLVNLFYLLGFFLSSISAFFALRWLGGHRATSLAAAVLFAFAPYHFIRGTSHLVYASYAVVPIGVVLAVRVGRGRHPLSGIRAAGSRRWLHIVGWVVAAALVGSCNSYYAAFSAILIATAALATALAARSWRPVLAGAVTIVLIGAVLGANLLPSILYSHEHGKNDQVAQRQAQEVDIYGLRFVQMLTPIPDHRIEPLRTLSDDLLKGPYNSEASMFLGIVAGVGLLGMIGSLLVRAIRPRRRVADDADDDHDDSIDADERDDVRPLLGVMTIVAILIATIGGLAWFFALAGATELRGWNRISIVIAFLALAWLVLTVDRLLAGHVRDPRWRALVAVGAIVVIVAGIADQTSKAIVPDRRAYAAEFHADRQYFGAIESRLPRGAAVFQVPYVPYPEAGPYVNIIDYDPLRPFLSTKDLRWSYGGMRGRASDWQAVTSAEPAEQMVQDAIATGFSGILVDRNGYQDKGEQLTADLAQITGDQGFASPDDRWVYFDLAAPTAQYKQSTTVAQRAERRAEVLAARP